MGCSAEQANDDNDDVEVREEDLTSQERALAKAARLTIDGAAEQFQGAPNYVVGLRPSPQSALKLLWHASGPVDQDAFAELGATNLGAARINGFIDAIPQNTGYSAYYIGSNRQDGNARGFVVHSMKFVEDCTSAKISVFAPNGKRVLRLSATRCD